MFFDRKRKAKRLYKVMIEQAEYYESINRETVNDIEKIYNQGLIHAYLSAARLLIAQFDLETEFLKEVEKEIKL